MAIIQISKIQQRSGNLVDLPQLDEGEFGWASDTKRLFIGKTTPSENIEVLTSYTNINFNQIDGSGDSQLNISNPADGEILGFQSVGSTYYVVNKGGTDLTSPGGLINLGNVSNVKLGGGSTGYVLETDGLGNLSWTPKGTLYTNILDLSPDSGNGNIIVMSVANTTPYTNAMMVTITGAEGANVNTIVNGQTFYVKLAVDFASSGNVTLYTDSSLSTPSDGEGLTYTNSPNAIATTNLSGSSGTVAAGSNTTIQFNSSGLLAGDGDFTFTPTGVKTLSVNGNANVGNLNSTSNVVTGGIKTDNYYYANGAAISFAGSYSNSNVASYLPTYTGTIGTTALTTGSNVTVGLITGDWQLTSGSKMQATYADLAEYYEADQPYEPGTVVEFGGEKEVTVAQDGTTRVAGVISTDPAYVMNTGCPGYAVAIALQGRVPCKVRGKVRKGDMMVSAGSGFARAWNNAQPGMIIGKSIENFDGVEGTIEIAVGRL